MGEFLRFYCDGEDGEIREFGDFGFRLGFLKRVLSAEIKNEDEKEKV